MIFNCAFNDEGKVLVYNEGRKCELEMTGMISRLSVYMEGRDEYALCNWRCSWVLHRAYVIIG